MMKNPKNINNDSNLTMHENDCNTQTIFFKTGEALIIDKYKNELQLLDADKNLQLTISATKKGLVLNMDALQINIQALNQLNLSGNRINIEASEQINIKTSGNLVQQVEKDFLTEVGGSNKMIAQVQKITASLGNVDIKANDDVRLEGERVFLNCD